MHDKRTGDPRVVALRRAAVAVLTLTLCASAVTLAQKADAPERAEKATLAVKSLLLDAEGADGLLVVVGERGHILTSADSGETWRQADVPTRATLTGVSFADRNHGLAVGHDSVILRTSDGGATWNRVHWDPEADGPFLDVWFGDAKNGIVIGAYGRCSITRDGGTTWVERTVSGDDFHLNQIAAAAGGRLYIAAEGGNVYRSDDAGESWTALASPYAGSFFGVLPLEGNSVLVFGLRGHMYRSDDAGATWAPIETGTVAMLNSGIRLGDGRIVIAGLGGVVLVSADGGRTFALRQQSSRAGIQALVDAGDGRLLLAGEFGVRRTPMSEISGEGR